MVRNSILYGILLIGVHAASAQVGIGTTTPNSDAMLDVTSAAKGLLPPRVALTATSSPSPLSAHVAGMVVYNTATAGSGSTAVAPGIYINDGTSWRVFTTVSALPLSGPIAQNVAISAVAPAGTTLSSSYAYYSPSGVAENASGPSYQWYRGTDNSGTTDVAISGATGATYTLTAADAGAYIRVMITPRASSSPYFGPAAYSNYIGPVFVCGTSTVSFRYNGASVTYKTIVSPTTGVCYLDRNLGAAQAATSSTDYLGYGDLFQWGRPADGHQLITWTSSTAGTAVNGTTTTLSTTDVPGNSLFIMPPGGANDWRSTQNDNLWQGRFGVNNPCPIGWYVPTSGDWAAETGITDTPTGYSQLKLPLAGWRYFFSGTGPVQYSGGTSTFSSCYWSSTVNSANAYYFTFASGTRNATAFQPRALGGSVRCRR